MKKPPAVDGVLAQLAMLSVEDLQLVIQTADNIRQDLDNPPPPPEVIESLAEELREISDIDISIPIQLQFQLQTRLKYQGPGHSMPGHSMLDRLQFDSVIIKEQGKCTIPVERVLLPHEGEPEGLLEEILMSFDPETPKDILLGEGAKKACPALVAYMARIEAFENKLDEEGEKLDMDAQELYDTVDWSAAPKKGKKKASKKRATRARY